MSIDTYLENGPVAGESLSDVREHMKALPSRLSGIDDLCLTADQQAALAGTSGTAPSGANKLVDAADTKLPATAFPAHASHGFVKGDAAGTALETVTFGTASNTVCQGDDARLPTAGEKTALTALTAERTDIATDVGMLYHVKISTAGGATANTDKALPTGTWEVVDCVMFPRGLGTAGDTVQLLKDTGGAITNAMDANVADNTRTVPTTMDDAQMTFIGGTDSLRVTETDGGGNDSPVVDVHVTLRKIA